ncbi:DUF2254 family protein [Streptomyces sp. NBC_01198]|uniref:DUF2254 family protein n=1 Tax=Streptomyces sp. NBC_01198 TaxID=2903769 RepID=UPI002E1317E9|nr:DUF2254 domain-containing protein [Streptomyces sp. NBC_01198]
MRRAGGRGRTPLPRRRRLRAGLVQLLATLAGLGLGLLGPRISGGPAVPGRPVVDMLLALGVGVLGTVTVIFSLLFLVVQWAHTSFTPRLALFRDAPIVWRTFAFAIGLAVFCVTAALTVGGRAHVSVALPALAAVLLLVMLALLRVLQLRALGSIELAPVLHTITERGRAALDALYPPDGPAAGSAPTSAAAPPVATVSWPNPSAVLQEIDVERLLESAHAAGAVVVLCGPPGSTLRHGAAIAEVHGAALPDAVVLGALATGVEPTFDRDPVLAFRLLADIALRALSPAVNDPATAVQALDCLEDLLGGPAARRTHRAGPLRVAGPDGRVRLVVRRPEWEDFFRTGLDDVIAAANSPMVLARIRTLLERLAATAPAPGRSLPARRLTWVEAEFADRFPALWREAEAGRSGSG